ncbi:hypothetical protein B0B18_29765 [Pseudomonas aeruginosa]|nr:hypothetical protein B0B18_29765 [Pseudomonas aeruginosa]
MLSDPVIRAALLDKLNRGRPQPKALIEELRIHNGNAIADIVAVYNEAHCYEIKGENDKIERIIEQGRYYDRAFRKVTLVTTSRHIRKAVAIAPEHWGILEAKRNNVGKVTFKAIRSARKNIGFDKKVALLTLWRNELIEIANQIEEKVGAKANRDTLSQLISQSYGIEELSHTISKALAVRGVTRY